MPLLLHLEHFNFHARVQLTSQRVEVEHESPTGKYQYPTVLIRRRRCWILVEPDQRPRIQPVKVGRDPSTTDLRSGSVPIEDQHFVYEVLKRDEDLCGAWIYLKETEIRGSRDFLCTTRSRTNHRRQENISPQNQLPQIIQ